ELTPAVRLWYRKVPGPAADPVAAAPHDRIMRGRLGGSGHTSTATLFSVAALGSAAGCVRVVGVHRRCGSSTTSSSRSSDRRGRTASVREVGGFRRPARNWLSHSAPSPSYSSSAAACRVQFGLYRWVLPTAMRSARLANRIEFASSND